MYKRWDKELHPTVYYLKRMANRFAREYPIALYCDFHGHSKWCVSLLDERIHVVRTYSRTGILMRRSLRNTGSSPTCSPDSVPSSPSEPPSKTV